MKSMMSFIIVVLVAYLGVCAFLFYSQRSLIYYPVPETSFSTATAVYFDTGDANIKVWQIGSQKKRALLYFGGNAEDVGLNIDDFAAAFPDYAVYLLNYRGYGGSTGAPSEQGINRDALYVFDELAEVHTSVSVVGRSLGSGVATYLAVQRKLDRLVLVTPFDSVVGIAQAFYRFLPVGLLLQDRYDSVERADRIRCPTFVLIASDDEVIPREHTNRLVEAIKNAPLTVRVIDGATHNTIGTSQQYMALLSEFMQP